MVSIDCYQNKEYFKCSGNQLYFLQYKLFTCSAYSQSSTTDDIQVQTKWSILYIQSNRVFQANPARIKLFLKQKRKLIYLSENQLNKKSQEVQQNFRKISKKKLENKIKKKPKKNKKFQKFKLKSSQNCETINPFRYYQ
ncbi:hypothetical protein pb186bvf_000679 [Paramecium bursaria]